MRYRSSLRLLAALAALSLPAAALADPPAPTPGASCGNGLLDSGETCQSCPADCTPRPCTASGQRPAVEVAFTAPRESLNGDVRSFTPIAATLTVTYRTDRLQLPGKGLDKDVRARVTDVTSASESVTTNDLDYALRLVVTDTARIPPHVGTIAFDTCKGAPAATDADLTCVVDACAGHGGPLADCYCKATITAATSTK